MGTFLSPKDIKLHHFFQIFLGSMPLNPPSKGHGFTIMWLCAAYCFDTCKLTFQTKILTPYQILYTPRIH